MAVVQRHTSPDGLLSLVVDVDGDGDWAVGFEGYAWHTHGDMLTHEYGGSRESAVRAFVDDIIAARRRIGVSRVGGAVRDVWVIDDRFGEADLMKYAEPNETIEIRLWNGLPANAPPPPGSAG
jgi:hypothetical protein